MAASALPASGLNREHLSDLHLVATCGRASPLARGVSRSTLAIFLPPLTRPRWTREFNVVEPEDEMNWWVVGQRAATFDFREGEVVRFAQAHGVKVRGNC